MSLQPGTTPQNAETQNTQNVESGPKSSSPNIVRPVHTVRSGAIGASIWQNKNDNFGITFSRSWKSQDGDTGHSKTFYAGNRKDLHAAVDAACDMAESFEQVAKRRIDELSSDVQEGKTEHGGMTNDQ